MNERSDSSASESVSVDSYVAEFRRRFRDFEAARQAELRHMKHDFIARLFSDHVVLGDKPTYDGMLQGMLKDAERDKLETDPQFTRAWRIFVDLCWLKKRFARAALILGLLIFALAAALVLFFGLLYVARPNAR
ncbi:MAG TPA: hypothetical protein VMV72_13415 [Verrucomicrobiae bacterium]|nr:hypothetical protein [Verrucomicrobiae bacterium]